MRNTSGKMQGDTTNSNSHFHLTSVSREASSRRSMAILGRGKICFESCSLQLLGWVQQWGEEKLSVCVSTCWSRQNIWCVCVGDGSFSFAKGNGIWHTLTLPHHTHRADTAALFFSGPQNGPHHCVRLSQTPTFNPRFVSGSFQPLIYSLLYQFFLQ